MVWIGMALAGGFEELSTSGDCTIYRRSKTEVQGSALKAVCDWPDVEPAALDRMLSDFGRYDEWIWPIHESEVRRVDGDRTLVYQLQKIWALSDREVLVWADRTDIPRGFRSTWVTATEEPLPPRKGTIRTPRNEGFWEVTANPAGGSHVTHQIGVDAGGVPLPGWLLRAIQGRGFARVMKEVREHGLSQAK